MSCSRCCVHKHCDDSRFLRVPATTCLCDRLSLSTSCRTICRESQRTAPTRGDCENLQWCAPNYTNTPFSLGQIRHAKLYDNHELCVKKCISEPQLGSLFDMRDGSGRSVSHDALQTLTEALAGMPSVFVSDFSDDLTPDDRADCGAVRRISLISTASTVSSMTLSAEDNQRGSLLDLAAEGLVMSDDGRLQSLQQHRTCSQHHSIRSAPSLFHQHTESSGLAQYQCHTLENNNLASEKHSDTCISVYGSTRSSNPTNLSVAEMTSSTMLSQNTQQAVPRHTVCQQNANPPISVIPPHNHQPNHSQNAANDENPRDNQLSRTSSLTMKHLFENIKISKWRKIRGVVQWVPFFRTFKKQYTWVQLAGHQDNFHPCSNGTILKKSSGQEEICLEQLMDDALRPFVPQYYGKVVQREKDLLQMQDLLAGMHDPCVMDCKIGVRTYLEEELAKFREKPKLRKDMYDKMIAVDENAPTQAEHKLKAVTKSRYMMWRETISSTASLGFRIEGVRRCDGFTSKDFKTTRSARQVSSVIQQFISSRPHVVMEYLDRLKQIRQALTVSQFFRSHELIGSSLLFVHDTQSCGSGVWMIDFAKTVPVPDGVHVHHDRAWQPGNHEDGYLLGVDNLISLLQHISTDNQLQDNEPRLDHNLTMN